MRGLKSTIALAVVLVGLGAYIYFVTSKLPDSTTPAKEKVFPRGRGEQHRRNRRQVRLGRHDDAQEGRHHLESDDPRADTG
jgi:hypothetical protein